jgi:hypothetical protein
MDAETNVGINIDDEVPELHTTLEGVEVQCVMIRLWVGIGADRASCTRVQSR